MNIKFFLLIPLFFLGWFIAAQFILWLGQMAKIPDKPEFNYFFGFIISLFILILWLFNKV